MQEYNPFPQTPIASPLKAQDNNISKPICQVKEIGEKGYIYLHRQCIGYSREISFFVFE